MITYESILNSLLTPGAVGVMPVDTVYGLVCRALDQDAVERLYQLKSREHKPGTIIAADIDQLESVGVKRRYLTAVSQFWPGAVSVVVPSSHDYSYLDQEKGSLAVRIPAPPALRELLQQTGPLLTSSANLPGEPASQTAAEAMAFFDDDVDFYLDGGFIMSEGSTIIQIVDDEIEILRRGDVEIQDDLLQ